jgi:hypothetical protein
LIWQTRQNTPNRHSSGITYILAIGTMERAFWPLHQWHEQSEFWEKISARTCVGGMSGLHSALFSLFFLDGILASRSGRAQRNELTSDPNDR